MPRTHLTAALAALALVAAGCGSDDDDGSSAAGNGTDRAFVADMVPHHRSAVEMAKIAQGRGESAFVKQLADDIVRSQSEEITKLEAEDAELAEAGIERGELGMDHSMMAMGDMDVASLKTADPFDEAFLRMMLPHHESALEMAKAELEKGEDPELRQLAEEIIASQEREIRAMREQL